MLLISQLDTVVEGPNELSEKVDSIVMIAGSSIMNGGDVIITDALKALHATGVLRKLNVTVVMNREEEYSGDRSSRRGQRSSTQRS